MLDKSEKDQVDHWINHADENRAYFETMRMAWERTGDLSKYDQIDLLQQWEVFKANHHISTSSHVPRKVARKRMLGLAASVTLMLVAFLAYMTFDNSVVYVAENTPLDITLPDGSHLWLNKHSEVNFDWSFDGETRKVNLTGEGYFEVVENPEKPFIVSVNETQTKVLGTSFNLKSIGREGAELVLISGKVAFSNKTQSEIVKPGEKIVSAMNGKLSKKQNDDPNFLAWKTGILIFEETTLDAVMNTVESYTGNRIRIENRKFKQCTFTGKFNLNSIDEVLEIFETLYGFQVSKSDSGKYILKGGEPLTCGI